MDILEQHPHPRLRQGHPQGADAGRPEFYRLAGVEVEVGCGASSAGGEEEDAEDVGEGDVERFAALGAELEGVVLDGDHGVAGLPLLNISEPTRLDVNSYSVFCLE
ncbi:hypothetical protein, partial [Streptomyces sp. McG6]|uniref:hypothetical protein n=1 Tax=Streptomyces sp. McG6 TaxID=2725485 RepID=UPI001BE6CA9C